MFGVYGEFGDTPMIVNATTPNSAVHGLPVPLRGTSSRINYEASDVGYKGITKRIIGGVLRDEFVQTRQDGKLVDLGSFPTLARFNALANISQTLAGLTIHTARLTARLEAAVLMRLYDQVSTPTNRLTHDLWRINSIDFDIGKGTATLSCSGVL